METSRYICLTPTRNESWIIRPFLAAAKTWATDVIVADQGSTDGTLQTLESTPGVTPVINDSPVFDEVHRQKLLISAARKLPGRRVLIALDADEALSADCMSTSDWARIQTAAPGTQIRFRWVNILPGFKEAWIPREHRPFGLVDDGAEHSGRTIHNPRLPWRENAPVLDLDSIVVLHFQYVLWDRMRSKQRWYQAWEYTKHKASSPLDIFRQYNHMNGGWKESDLGKLRPEWFKGYQQAGADFSHLQCEPVTWWDREVLNMLAEHGPGHFRRIAVWEKDWQKLATDLGVRGNFADPRSVFERWAHRRLAATQNRRADLGVRALEKLLRSTGW